MLVAAPIRLAGGNTANEGRVEIKYDGEWGTVCNNGWDLTDAVAVCKDLGHPGAEKAVTSGDFGPGSGPIFLDEVDCSENETSFFNCPSNGYYNNTCSHSQDAGVICSRK